MIRRLLPYSLSCAGTLIVLPSVAANTGDTQVTTGLASTDIGMLVIAIGGALLLTWICSISATRIAGAVRERIDRRRLRGILQAASVDLLHDFILPGAYGGLTRIDHGVLTRAGIFCIQTRRYHGIVSGNADDPQWVNVDGSSRKTFLNPLIQNEGRTRALQNVVPGVPVANLVVFMDTASFATPMQDNVIHLRDLDNYLASFTFEPCAADLGESWLRLKSAVLKDEESRKDFNAQLSFS